MSKSKIVTFLSLTYYIEDFLKKTLRDHHSMVTHVFSNSQLIKILEEKICKNMMLHFSERSVFEIE